METPTQAIILAGGQATRMRPYTDDAPKAMVPVADVPIIGYQLVWLARQGITDVVVSGGYRHEMIKHYAGDGARFGVHLTYAIESEPLGRGGALKFATAFLRDPADPAPVAVLNGDIVTGFSLVEMAERHRMRQAAVTIALSQYRSNWGSPTWTSAPTGSSASPRAPYSRTGSTRASTSSTPAPSRSSPTRATTRTPPSPNWPRTVGCSPTGSTATGAGSTP